MLLAPWLLLIIWFMMLWNHVGVSWSPWPWWYGFFIWIWVLVTWPIPHPICVAVGTCQYFCLGMGEWSTCSGVAGWTVMKNTLGNQTEHLQRGSENTWRLHHPSMTIITSLVMKCLWTILVKWAGRTKALPGPSRGNINKNKWPIPKQKYWQVQSATHMGWGIGQVTRTQSQIKSP